MRIAGRTRSGGRVFLPRGDASTLIRDNDVTSKVPFYVAGGLLAVWAVLLALWGITHEEFPGSTSRARLVMLTSFVLVAATITSAVLTGGEEVGRSLSLAADPGGALKFDKTSAEVLSGRVTIEFTNDSAVQHNVTIAQGRRKLGATKTITDSTDTLALDLSPGEYVFYCSVTGHREAGMEGTLDVDND